MSKFSRKRMKESDQWSVKTVCPTLSDISLIGGLHATKFCRKKYFWSENSLLISEMWVTISNVVAHF